MRQKGGGDLPKATQRAGGPAEAATRTRLPDGAPPAPSETMEAHGKMLSRQVKTLARGHGTPTRTAKLMDADNQATGTPGRGSGSTLRGSHCAMRSGAFSRYICLTVQPRNPGGHTQSTDWAPGRDRQTPARVQGRLAALRVAPRTRIAQTSAAGGRMRLHHGIPPSSHEEHRTNTCDKVAVGCIATRERRQTQRAGPVIPLQGRSRKGKTDLQRQKSDGGCRGLATGRVDCKGNSGGRRDGDGSILYVDCGGYATGRMSPHSEQHSERGGF